MIEPERGECYLATVAEAEERASAGLGGGGVDRTAVCYPLGSISTTIERQLLFHRGVSICNVGMLRRAQLQGGQPEPVITESFRDELLAALEPALSEAWPDHPDREAIEDLDGFLEQASNKLLEAAKALDKEEGFVPAAGFDRIARNLTFEHLQEEIEAIRGGVVSEGLLAQLRRLRADGGNR